MSFASRAGWFARIVVPAVMLSACGVSVLADAAFDPVQDDPALPRVLLIGDSISIGYTVPVRQMLQGKANVHRIPVNGQDSGYGLANIREWLGDGKWDVIHFNFGIWDTHLLDSSGALISDKDELAGVRQGTVRTPLGQYQANLNKLIDIMEPTGAKLIWASSTPLTCRKGERLGDMGRYNAAAAEVMKLRLVATDDLHSLMTPHLSQMQSDDGCHFTPQGYQYLGEHVARSIMAALPATKAKPETWLAEETGKEVLNGRNVLRFEHDCLRKWGYTEKARQYFYVVEPKLRGNGPLLVCLHSAGGDGRSEMPANAQRVAEAGDDFTGLILNSGSGAEWWWGAKEIEAKPDVYKRTLTPVENRVLATIEWVVQRYHIDRNRIYLRGISMGGSGTLGIGMCHGGIFAALLAGVPAGTAHARYRLSNPPALGGRAGTVTDVPPVLVFFSQKDDWSKGMEEWLDVVNRGKLSVVAAWGPWGHANHYEMTNPAAYEYPWLAIRKNQAYPVFLDASSDDKYPGFKSDAPCQNGQINAYFRWNVLEDQPGRFAMELRLVQSRELDGAADIPAEAVTDVALRRLQHFQVSAGKACRCMIEQQGCLVQSSEVTADRQGLITIPRLKITARPIVVRITSE